MIHVVAVFVASVLAGLAVAAGILWFGAEIFDGHENMSW